MIPNEPHTESNTEPAPASETTTTTTTTTTRATQPPPPVKEQPKEFSAFVREVNTSYTL